MTQRSSIVHLRAVGEQRRDRKRFKMALALDWRLSGYSALCLRVF